MLFGGKKPEKMKVIVRLEKTKTKRLSRAKEFSRLSLD